MYDSHLETRRLCDEGKGAAEAARKRIRKTYSAEDYCNYLDKLLEIIKETDDGQEET